MKRFLILLIASFFMLCACNTVGKTANRQVEKPFAPQVNAPRTSIGEVEIQFNKMFPLPGLRQVTVNASYNTNEDAVCLQFRLDLVTYRQFWSLKGRQGFITALANYKTDFEERNFGRGGRSALRQYGSARGYISWQTTSLSVLARAGANVDFGYTFVDRSPYFVIRQQEAIYKDPNASGSDRTLPEFSMYFTRAQADALAALFDEDFLETTTAQSGFSNSPSINYDEY